MLFVRFILIVVLMFSFSTSSVAKGPFNRIFHNDWFSENSPVPGAIESRMGTNGNDGSIFVVYCPTLGGLKPPALAGSFSISCLRFCHE